MALTTADLQAIADLLQPIKNDVQEIKHDMQELKDDNQKLTERVTSIELTLDNVTNKNIQLLAENHITLINKLNDSIKVADKTLMFEIQLTSLKSRIDTFEKELAEIKKSIA